MITLCAGVPLCRERLAQQSKEAELAKLYGTMKKMLKPKPM